MDINIKKALTAASNSTNYSKKKQDDEYIYSGKIKISKKEIYKALNDAYEETLIKHPFPEFK